MDAMTETFSQIYERAVWSGGSGSGSQPDATIQYRRFLEYFIETQNIQTIVDFGCGDWQFSKLIDWKSRKYVGIDAVPSLIHALSKTHTTDKISFAVGTSLQFDAPSADLLLLKDVFQHWPNEMIKRSYDILGRFRFVLITNTRSMKTFGDYSTDGCDAALNKDILLGAMRPIDLAIEPFGWPVLDILTFHTPRKRIPSIDIKVTSLLIGSAVIH